MTAVVAALVALALVVCGAALSRRAVRRRVDTVVARLDSVGGGGEAGGRGRDLDASLDRLHWSGERVARFATEAQVKADRLAHALEAIPQGVVVCDHRGREVFRNGGARLFAEGRHADALVEQTVQEQLQASLAGAPQRRDLDLFGPPSRVLVVTTAAARDGTTGAVAVIDDVSERRRLEAVRRDFVANISHELKTPVGALGLLAETIAAEEDPTVSRRLAGRMTGEAIRVGRIIDDLLELSRIEAEEIPRRGPMAVHQVVAEAVDRVRPLAQARGIEVSAQEVLRRHAVTGDRRQLVSALANLLENACKYSDAGSTVEVGSRSEGAEVEVWVRDRGIGIPGRDLERVFERFYRVDRARSRETGGTGLGLAIVRHVAVNHGGEIRVVSREGEGSTFTLRLPAGSGPFSFPVAVPGVSPGPTPDPTRRVDEHTG